MGPYAIIFQNKTKYCNKNGVNSYCDKLLILILFVATKFDEWLKKEVIVVVTFQHEIGIFCLIPLFRGMGKETQIGNIPLN
ncbi:hypothetical protein A9498_30205 (plasmid) [Bacillus thuringiensis serovar coreanensis]|nr:hypothetical protein A9498_30205 [Bacillus thuringiensis serovar coreanensis]